MTFLAFDLSTQQLKATLLDENGKVIRQDKVIFDSLRFDTKDGVFVNGLQVTSPVLMWIGALDILLEKLSDLLPNVKAVSGCAQQHATVYYSEYPDLSDHSKSLSELFKGCFCIENSPIWQDHSTTDICKELEGLVGSGQELAILTGSSVYERFSASQIAKLARTQSDKLEQTIRIGLASSLIPSILLGKFANLDPSDASGMNLMNISTKSWNHKIANFCHPELITKLGPIGKCNEILGKIDSYFTNKYCFPPDCVISTFTGDNPATISSCPLKEGDLVISLGTSDTCTFITSTPKPMANAGHVFCNPNDPSSFMAMVCFRNGSLAREKVRDMYANGDWEKFNAQVKDSSPDPTKLGFYFFDHEIIPKGLKGQFCFVNGKFVDHDDIDSSFHARRIVESQALIQYHYSCALGLTPKRIICQGGGSKNSEILQIIANVFGTTVFTLKVDNGASLGACYRSMYAVSDGTMTYPEFLEGVHPGFIKIAEPDLDATGLYRQIDITKLLAQIL
jgi:xylulokinase